MFGRKKKTSAAQKVLDLCVFYIEKFENADIGKPSCKKDLMTLIENEINKAAQTLEAAEQNPNIDYTKLATSMLINGTFDLLASGNYHSYRGMLNPFSCADNLIKVYDGCMDYAVAHGYITEYEKNADRSALMRSIQTVG